MSLIQLNNPPDFRPVRQYTCFICHEPHPADGPEQVVLIRNLFFCASCLLTLAGALTDDPAKTPAAAPEPTDTG